MNLLKVTIYGNDNNKLLIFANKLRSVSIRTVSHVWSFSSRWYRKALKWSGQYYKFTHLMCLRNLICHWRKKLEFWGEYLDFIGEKRVSWENCMLSKIVIWKDYQLLLEWSIQGKIRWTRCRALANKREREGGGEMHTEYRREKLKEKEHMEHSENLIIFRGVI